jgi:hypothetical protein
LASRTLSTQAPSQWWNFDTLVAGLCYVWFNCGSYNKIRKYIMEVQPRDTSRGHFYVSLAKSGLRILAGVFLIKGDLIGAGALFILAEFLGIAEELV